MLLYFGSSFVSKIHVFSSVPITDARYSVLIFFFRLLWIEMTSGRSCSWFWAGGTGAARFFAIVEGGSDEEVVDSASSMASLASRSAKEFLALLNQAKVALVKGFAASVS